MRDTEKTNRGLCPHATDDDDNKDDDDDYVTNVRNPKLRVRSAA